MSTPVLGAVLGIALGARHAIEPDHLAALSVLATERGPAEGRGGRRPKQSPRRGALLGALWGLGHSIALLSVGLLLAAMSAELPVRAAAALELAVAVMLVVLGGRAVFRAVREGRTGASVLHHHGHEPHDHPGPQAHVHLGRHTFALRPLVVGLIHGLAGSGALAALALAELPSLGARLAFMALFGLGSIAAMTVLSGLAGWPLARLSRRPEMARLLSGAAGLLSTVLGVAWGWPMVGRLFG